MELFEDYLDFFKEINISSKELSIFDNFPKHFEELLKNTVIIPKRKIQLSLWQWLVLTPSTLAVSLPRVLCYGDSGTGKSTFSKTAKAIRGLPNKAIRSGKTTGASFRNDINSLKFGDDYISKTIKGELEELPQENDVFIIQDDINSQMINQDLVLLSILKSGIDRSTSTLAIANPGTGTNIEFDIFGSFIFSSCDPIWQNPELFELKRRLIIFHFKKFSQLTENDKTENLSPDNLIDLDWYNFTEFKGFDCFWDKSKRLKYVTLLKATWFKQAVKFNGIIPLNFCKLFYNLIATGFFINNDYEVKENRKVFDDVFQVFIDYYRIFLNLIDSKSPLEMWLEDYLSQVVENIEKQRQFFQSEDPIEIECKIFNDAIQKAHKNGNFYEALDKKNITRLMSQHGFKQTRSSYRNNLMVWQKI
jgi:hypothetical protein